MAAFFALLVASVSTGCLRKDYPVDAPVVRDVELLDVDAVDRDEVLNGLATAASPRFLGIWDGVVFDYEVYDEALLERDLERIERYYRARGYHEAKVTAARVLRVDEHRVRVQIRVSEGPPVLVRSWTAAGLEKADIGAGTAALRAIGLARDRRFDEADYERSKAALVTVLANHGYAFAKVKGHVRVDIANHAADVAFDVTPGPKAVYGPVRVVGLREIPEGPVRANLDIEPGKPYSRAELDDARTALVNLGVFATVDVRQDLEHPETGAVPVTVVVQEAELRTARVGGGMRFDVLEWSSNLNFGWEHRNFLGGMRRFSIDSHPGVVFFPTRMDNFVWPTNYLPKLRARAELRQPAFLEGRTEGFVASEFNVYPLLYPGLDASENVLGYDEVKAQGGVERAFFGHHVYATLAYDWQANFPFAYIGKNTLDKAFVSYPELGTVLDLRDDPIDPHRGIFLSNKLQVAGYVFGGDVSDVREQPELRTYVPISKSVTLATRATVGFLFPHGYGETLQRTVQRSDPDYAEELRDQQLLLFRAFYSGGPDSNRGYPFRGVGPQGVVGFLVPSSAACGDFASQTNDSKCQKPLGGLTLWEASIEVRFPLFGPLRSAVFLDASDVNREIATIRFGAPHLSPGLGLRYATPVGPIRLDVGYRLPIGPTGKGTDYYIAPQILGLPIALSFGLGEAY